MTHTILFKQLKMESDGLIIRKEYPLSYIGKKFISVLDYLEVQGKERIQFMNEKA